jgi:hypothetical protein
MHQAVVSEWGVKGMGTELNSFHSNFEAQTVNSFDKATALGILSGCLDVYQGPTVYIFP